MAGSKQCKINGAKSGGKILQGKELKLSVFFGFPPHEIFGFALKNRMIC